MSEPEFRLVPIAHLRAHEQYEEPNVRDLVEEIRAKGVFADPIWVARGTYVILNGHHRVEAARRLGLREVPAWVIEYDCDLISLEPWSPGPPIAKAEVVRRALAGELFPPKTTRHRLRVTLPMRSMSLGELLRTGERPAAQADRGDVAPARKLSPGRSG